MRRVFPALIVAIVALGLAAQMKYAGPKPEKKDVPYLIHAATLVQTEIVRSSPKADGDSTTWSIPGETSLARTPLALPAFVIDAGAIAPDKLQLYPFEQKGGRRELTLKRRPNPDSDDTLPILITVAPLSGTLYRVEVVNEVPNGEYGFTTPGSNQFFCFTVF
jgi:hypothetical protein